MNNSLTQKAQRRETWGQNPGREKVATADPEQSQEWDLSAAMAPNHHRHAVGQCGKDATQHWQRTQPERANVRLKATKTT